jgi:hypothetical protein
MNVRINGSLAPQSQAPEIVYDPNRGQIITQRWESAGDNLLPIANACIQARMDYRYVRSQHKSSLVANAAASQLGYADVICDVWTIQANEIQKALQEHPGFQAMEAAHPGTLGYVARDVDLYNQGMAPGTPAPDSGAMPQSGYLFNLLIKGTAHYALGQYVLKHSTNVSNTYSANISDVNVERIYTTEQLLAETTNSGLWTYPLPGRLQYKLQNIPAPAAQTNYLWSWRKLPSTESTSANNRVEISTEYWLELWHTFIYPPVV